MEACEASPGLPEALLHVQAALEAVGTRTDLPQVRSCLLLFLSHYLSHYAAHVSRSSRGQQPEPLPL